MPMLQPCLPPVQMKVLAKGGRDTLQPMPWPSLFIYLAQVQLKTRATIGSLVLLAPPISLWMESCFHNEKIWKRAAAA